MTLNATAAFASGPFSILDFGPEGSAVDQTGHVDVSAALAGAVTAANTLTLIGLPGCVYIPSGLYRIVRPPPMFQRAGCIKGDGSSQSILLIDPNFQGDLFAWSEAWASTTPGPTVVGVTVRGDPATRLVQNAFVFYDRNDQVFIDDVGVMGLHGRAIYSGVTKSKPQAYMRESHLRSLRFYGDGAPDVPVVEFSSEGTGDTDATNEIRLSQVDIFGANGPSFIIRNNGSGGVRDITIDSLRVEGWADARTKSDLITIGDTSMIGNVNNVTLTNLELIQPSKGFAALRLTAAPYAVAPYQISVQGFIGGGAPAGQGLRIDAGRTSSFRFSGIHTIEENIVIGRRVSEIVLDGGGQEAGWTYQIDPNSVSAVSVPVHQHWPVRGPVAGSK